MAIQRLGTTMRGKLMWTMSVAKDFDPSGTKSKNYDSRDSKGITKIEDQRS